MPVNFDSVKFAVISGLFSILFLFGSSATAMAQSKSDSEIFITIERKSCFGSCPVYSAEIYTDGTVIYKGEHFVWVEGEERYKVPPVRIKMLIEEFQKINYFSLKDNYSTDENGISVTDMPTTITSISLNGKQKRVVNYYGALEVLEKLERKIEYLADLEAYIGPV